MKEFVKRLAAEQKEAIREDRHYLHQHPELSFEEYETSKWIKERLTALGIPMAEGITGTSVVGILEGSEPGPTIAFRADFDALPVDEDNDLPFKSLKPGVMHACGHDTHCATLMSFAAILARHPELIKGKVKFIFQAAEEKLPGGAVQLVKDGVMQDVDYAFGYHSASGLEVGKVLVNEGAVSAAVATYELKITGKGGHGSTPSSALNPMPIACMVGTALNQIKPEKVSPIHGTTVTVSYIHGGQYPNIIPGDCILGGNIRTLDNDDLKLILDNIEKISKGICEAWGASCDFSCVVGYPATINAPEQTALARSVVEELGYEAKTSDPNLGAEDFAYFSLEKPSCYFNVGGADPENPSTYSPHHNKNFMLDEDMLDVALECELGIYLRATDQK
jgi:amidohydrolase